MPGDTVTEPSTSRASRAARSSTKGCSRLHSSSSSTRICATSGWRAPLALVHSRFSTNTFPSWPLAHPYRYIAHNGEINTLKGNRNWMRAREALLESDVFPGDLERIFPICTPDASDSSSLRRGAGAPRARRPLAAALSAHDDPGGVGEPHVDERREEGVLPVPRIADGAVGRSGLDRVHGRHGDRRGARPKRAPAVAVLGDLRRPRDHGERSRCARARSRDRGQEGPARARADVPRRHRPGSDRRRRGDQARPRERAAVRAVARRRSRAPRRPAAP